jgi:hypothetical protein
MTHTPNNLNAMGSDPEDMSHVDPELSSLMAGLDMLGAADRGAPTQGFEGRLMQGSLAALHGVEPIVTQAAELGAMDRAAAPDGLEERVYAESVSGIAIPVLRHTGQAERADRQHIRVVHRAWWANQYMRLAAAIVLVAGVGVMVRTSVTPAPIDNALRVSGDLDLLFAVIDNRTSGSDSNDSGAASDPDELTKFLMEGSAS